MRMKPSTAPALSPARNCRGSAPSSPVAWKGGVRCRPRRAARARATTTSARARGVERELQRDVRSGRVADDMRPLDAGLAHQVAHMRSLASEADRSGDAAAVRIADAVKAQHAVATGERGFVQQGLEPLREQAGVNQDHRLSFASHRVLQLNGRLHAGPIHHRPCERVDRRCTRGPHQNRSGECASRATEPADAIRLHVDLRSGTLPARPLQIEAARVS